MAKPFFSKRIRFFGTYAMLILCMVCFLLPFAGRGARMAVRSMTNNVADWLPGSYEETQDLSRFREYFVGDQFVIVSGPWCRPGNSNFVKFERMLREESLGYEEVLRQTGREEELRAHQTGDELGLLSTGDYHENWGHERERWLLGKGGRWYFIDRRGRLFQWEGQNNIIHGMQRYFEKQVNGRNVAVGTYIDTFGEEPDDENGIENEFYADPMKLCARPFKSISTGPDIFEKMAGADGTRRIGIFSDDDATAFKTRIRTHQLLTGSLFGPTPEPTFSWTWESLLQHAGQQQVKLKSSPEYRERFKLFVDHELDEQFDGKFEQLRTASPDAKLDVWYRMWDALQLEPPPRQTCIVVTLNDPVLGQLDRVVGRPILGKPRGRILELAIGHCGIKAENLHIGGPPADNVAIDEEGTTTLLRLVNLSMLIGIGLAYASFRSIRLTIMLFFVGGVAAIASLAYVWFGGSTLDAILMSMPSLVYVLGLSGAVHVVNYYRDACHETGPETAPEVALKYGWFPCTLAAFTTALGLISLYTSQLIPIKKFGLFSAIATMGTVALLFTFLPSALTIWPPGYRRRKGDKAEVQPSRLTQIVTDGWMRIGEWVIRHNVAVVVTTVLLMAMFAWGITKVRTSVHLLKLFDSQAKILQDYRWLEENLGKLVPMELVINIDRDWQQEAFKQDAIERARAESEADANVDVDVPQLPEQEPAGEEVPLQVEYDQLAFDLKYSMLERMELSHRVRTNLERFFGPTGLDTVGPGMSTDVFVPIELIDTQLDPGKSIEVKFHPRNVLKEQLAEKRDYMVAEDYMAVGPDDDPEPGVAGREMWRISLRLAALNDVDYGDFVNNLKLVVEPIMKAYEFRTKLLRTLQDDLGEKSLTRGKILVLARNPDRIELEQIDQEQRSDGNIMELVNQTLIFNRTLRELLQNRGYSNISNRKPTYKEKRFTWVDPTIIDADAVNSDKFIELIKGHDAVVLTEDHELFDVELIQQHASRFIDARNHRFEIDPKTNLPLPGNLTAMQRIKQDEPLGVGTIYTGIIPIVYKAQNQLLKSLIKSIALAFVMIAVVMMILLRNWHGPVSPGNLLNARGGLVSMLPNVFPIVIIFGAMGHLRIAVDIGSMMTASVAMGVAVDDTIHFLNWYRKGLAIGKSRVDSIRMAYRRVATAMTQTTIIGGLGLSAFALSTFTPTQKFGILMLFLLTAALVGDLILLPAILASPLGRLFGKPQKPASDTGDTEVTDPPVIHEFEQVEREAEEIQPEGDYPDIHPDSLKHLKRRE